MRKSKEIQERERWIKHLLELRLKQKEIQQSKMFYGKYIHSKQWKVLKECVLEERGNFCECCDKETDRLDLHHITYDHVGYESREEVLLLCRDCHKDIHETIKHPPYDLERYQNKKVPRHKRRKAKKQLAK